MAYGAMGREGRLYRGGGRIGALSLRADGEPLSAGTRTLRSVENRTRQKDKSAERIRFGCPARSSVLATQIGLCWQLRCDTRPQARRGTVSTATRSRNSPEHNDGSLPSSRTE